MPDTHDLDVAEAHDDFGGMDRDLPHLLERRQALKWIGGVSLAGILSACGIGRSSDDATTSTAAGRSTTTTTAQTATSTTLPATTVGSSPVTTAAPGAEIPDETAGPFPADGSNGPNVFEEVDVVRTDLTTSFGQFAGTAAGIPLTLQLTIVDANTGSPIPEAVVYLWHCTADGRYSIYEVSDQNYLRGAQVADSAGRISFQSIFPGCYRGRWPHAHFEVYSSLEEAVNGREGLKTSQLALPQADCETVYADPAYGPSASNLSQLSLDTDGVFRDGWSDQLAVVAGSADDGYAASLLVRV